MTKPAYIYIALTLTSLPFFYKVYLFGYGLVRKFRWWRVKETKK